MTPKWTRAWRASQGAVVVVGLLALGATAAAQEQVPSTPTIRVVGEGKASARPDTAQVQLGVVTEGESASAALESNTQAMEKLFGVLERAGIAEKDVQTTSFNVSPRYSNARAGRPPEILGYQVGNTVRIAVRKIDRLGRILDEGVKAGSNQVHGITFSVAEPENVLDEARRKAIADARRKARVYAEAAGVQLGRLLLISDQPPPRVPVPYLRGMMAGEAAAAAVPVATGEQEYSVQVNVTYELKQ